ncbi:MAG: hypothetical protein Q8P76_00320 [bacterium]|nr:hypothetical protein [bacterium]
MLKIEGRSTGQKNGTEVSLKVALTSLVEDALLRNIGGPIAVTMNLFALFGPGPNGSWRVSGPAEEIAKIKEGWRFFIRWTSPEYGCGRNVTPHKAVYPGTPEFIPFFLKKIMGENSATPAGA